MGIQAAPLTAHPLVGYAGLRSHSPWTAECCQATTGVIFFAEKLLACLCKVKEPTHAQQLPQGDSKVITFFSCLACATAGRRPKMHAHMHTRMRTCVHTLTLPVAGPVRTHTHTCLGPVYSPGFYKAEITPSDHFPPGAERGL